MGVVTTATGRRNGHAPDDGHLRVAPDGGSWRARLPWLVLAVVLIAGGALVVAVWVSNLAARSPALAVAADVERGATLDRGDLRVVSVALDGQVPALGPEQIDVVVGRTVTATLPAGTLLSEPLLARSDLVPAGSDVVGLALEPGAYPVDDLVVGDQVSVLSAADGRAERLTEAQVHAVQPLGETTTTRFVSVVVPSHFVEAVTAAAAANQARLVLTGDSR